MNVKERKRAEATDSPPRRAVIYARTNTPDAAISIEEQCVTARAYAARHGMDVIKVYEDVGKSGSSTRGRDGLKQLLADATSKERDFDVIIVYDRTRWGRSLGVDDVYREYICRRAGVELRVCEEPPKDGTCSTRDIVQCVRKIARGYDKRFSSRSHNPCQSPQSMPRNMKGRNRWIRPYRGRR